MQPPLQNIVHKQWQDKDVHALAEVGLLSAGIIHEVKNALQGIANALFLLDREQDLKPRARTWIADARRELSRAFEVSHETLALVREDSAVSLRISDVLEDVLKAYAEKINYKGIRVHCHYKFHESIHAGPGAVRQIFANIILNALESAPSRGGKLTIHTRASRMTQPTNGSPADAEFDQNNGNGTEGRNGSGCDDLRSPSSLCKSNPVRGVEIVFADNGPGIPEQNKQKVFEPLFSTKKGTGSGLGLWVTEKLVRKQHGTLRLRSSVKKPKSGTCFSVFLPLTQN